MIKFSSSKGNTLLVMGEGIKLMVHALREAWVEHVTEYSEHPEYLFMDKGSFKTYSNIVGGDKDLEFKNAVVKIVKNSKA